MKERNKKSAEARKRKGKYGLPKKTLEELVSAKEDEEYVNYLHAQACWKRQLLEEKRMKEKSGMKYVS